MQIDPRVLRYAWHRERSIRIARIRRTCLINRAVVVFEIDEDPDEIPDGWEWVGIHEASVDHGAKCDAVYFHSAGV